MPLDTVIGDKVVAKDGRQSQVTALVAGNKYIGLYFTASWCGPCQQFTPVLSQWYKQHAKEVGAEIIFVSLDKNADEYRQYFATMPWKSALPFKDEHIEPCINLFGISGIPTLVWLDLESMQTITTNGVALLMGNPTAAWPFGQGQGLLAEHGASPHSAASSSSFQERPDDGTAPGVWQYISENGGVLADSSGRRVDWRQVRNRTMAIGLYFSAHWCAPCRRFTPVLADWYKAHGGGTGKEGTPSAGPFEIIFVSADQSQGKFTEYMGEMPWLAIPYSDGSRDALSSCYGVSGIPCLMTFDSATGQRLTDSARAYVESEPEGWPWAGKAEQGGGCVLQ